MLTLDELRARLRTRDGGPPAGALAKPPSTLTTAAEIFSELGFQTDLLDLDAKSSGEIDPWPNEWRFVLVEKGDASPFSGRISVGRAGNCDVVLRVPYVSKLHAHFLAGDDGPSLVDLSSSNGTFVNGRALEPRVPHRLVSVARVRFGLLSVLWCHRADLDELALKLGRPSSRPRF
jgi:hypothetical protein